jgi:hypothetical protein
MIVNGKKLISEQLNLTAPKVTQFDKQHSTPLTPVCTVPMPSTSGKICLDGGWHVKYNTSSSKNFQKWAVVVQPGKVFYADPEAERGEIPNWDRVGLAHIDEKECAMLVKAVTIPANWKNKKIFIRFNAIYPAGDIYINNQLLAEQRSGVTPLTLDVGKYVEAGKEAIIAVRLIRKHKFVKMDMVRHALEFAGLAQSVFIFAVERSYVADYHFIPELSPSFKNGNISGEVTVANPKNGTLAVTLSHGGKIIKKQKVSVTKAQDKYKFSLNITKPLLWNDEYPHLYQLEINFNGETYTFNTGFRRLELSPEGAKLNGNFVKFRGVNHLTFHHEFGMHTPKDWLRKNLELMKKANVNSIRTHYSGPDDLQDLCDELGIYLLQEIPIDWGTNYIHNPEWVGPAMHRIESIIRRDRHHVSLMVWSVGNENMPERAAVAADGWNHLKIYDEFCHLLDPSRPTMFPPPGPANKIEGIFELRVGDIADTHYSFNHAKRFLAAGKVANPNSWEADHTTQTKTAALKRGWSGCWFSSEWGISNLIPDLLNNPSANIISDMDIDVYSGKATIQTVLDRLDFEWGFMRSEKSCLGGAFFPWICACASASAQENPWGWMRHGEDADWGVVCADLTVKPEFWAMRHAYSPVYLPERLIWQKGQSDINFEVENQFNAINLDECIFRIQITDAGKWMTMMRKFFDVSVTCRPGGKVIMHIPLTEAQRKNLDADKALMVRITMLKPDGFKFGVGQVLVLPERMKADGDSLMPIGPDAVL